MREAGFARAWKGDSSNNLIVQFVQSEVSGVRDFFIVRLNAMDKAQQLFEANLTRVPTEVDKQISHIQDIMNQKLVVTEEKFESIKTQFLERDTRTEQKDKDGKVAIDAALQAQKEAVEKQNTSTTKQIDQLTALFQASIGAIERQFSDLKERVLLIEGRTAGLASAAISTQQTGTAEQMTGSYVLACIAFVVMSLLTVAGLLINLLKT